MEEKKPIVTEKELAEAFKPAKKIDKTEKSKKPKNKKKIFSIIVFVLGLIALIAGAIFLILKLSATPDIQDGEYLVSAKQWILQDNSNCASEEENSETNCEGGSGVIWQFTEIGKGTLTTNNHTNDYDFIWAIEDGKLKIETAWLYDLENEYDYKLDQRSGILELTADEETYTFSAVFTSE